VTSFCEGYIKEREPLRQKLEDDIRRFKQAGGSPKIAAPTASAHNYAEKKSRIQRNEDRKQRLGIDSKPKSPIRTIAFVHKRLKNRSASSDRS